MLQAALLSMDVIPVNLLKNGAFEPLLSPPDWFEDLKPWELDNFPVLECAVADFEAFWSGEIQAETFGPWEQDTASGKSVALEATPMPSEFGRVILLKNLGEKYEQTVATLQKARDNLLVHEALEKEIKKKEFLLHTIVHDLAGPLTSIRGAFHILGRGDLPREQINKLLEIGVRQTEKQHSMIREILDVFAAEVGSLNTLPPDSYARPLQVASDLKTALGSAFEAKGVGFSCSGDDLEVVGDTTKLERVVSNLVENALRHLPRGKAVEVRVRRTAEMGVVEVVDNGEGVPPAFAGQLFQKLVQGKHGKGKAGLGLYFCKLTVESWGGKIGYRDAESGGACFWFELPLRAVSDK